MQDLALALALAAYYVGSLIPVTSQLNLPVAAFVLVVLQALPLTWRRRWPVPVLFAVGIPSQLYAILGIPYGDVPFGPMIAYYTVMDRSSTRTRWAISLLVVFGLIRVQFLPYHTAYSFVHRAAGVRRRRHRRGVQPHPPGLHCARSRRAPSRRRPNVSGRWRWPPRRSGPGSPGNCTTWWRTT